MFLSLYLFDKSYLNIVTITFSALILTEFLNIYSEVLSPIPRFSLAARNPHLHDNFSILLDPRLLHLHNGLQKRNRRFGY
jgi:hypothetical protein